MKILAEKGFTFGLSSGIITTLGLMVGLFSSTRSSIVVLGGILTIAIADAFSDALSLHLAEEAGAKKSHKQIWGTTLWAFSTKFIMAMIFIIPVLLIKLQSAIIVNVIFGIILLVIFNYFIAKKQNKKPWKVIAEHLLITIMVIVLTFYVGQLIALIFI